MDPEKEEAPTLSDGSAPAVSDHDQCIPEPHEHDIHPDECGIDALYYFDRGIYTIPAHTPTPSGGCSCGRAGCTSQGKHPRVDLKPLFETPPAREQVESWQAKWPESNLAALTGRASGVTIIDIDGPAGEASLAAAQIEIPITPTVLTGKGRQAYFEYDERLSTVAGLLPGVDVRNDRGIAILPPSLHVNGKHYQWAPGLGLGEVALARVPQPFIDLNAPKPSKVKREATTDANLLDQAIGTILVTNPKQLEEERAFQFDKAKQSVASGQGNRNETLNDVAFALGGLAHRGLDRTVVEGQLAELFVCSDFSQAEFDATFESGWSSGSAQPRPTVGSRPAYPTDALPKSVRNYVEPCADTLGLPAEMIAPALLAFAGATAGDGYRLVLESGGDPHFGCWSEFPALWTMTVAGAGAGKSPAFKRARIFIDELQRRADVRHAEEMLQFQAEHREWKSKKRGSGSLSTKKPPAETRSDVGASTQTAFESMTVGDQTQAPPPTQSKSDNKVTFVDLTPEPQAPPEEVFVTTDTTVEGLARALSTSRGVALALDEARSWLHSLGAYNGKATGDRAKYLTMWSGDAMRVTRAKAETLAITNPVLGWVGGLQPMFAREFILGDGLGDGLPQRLLWSMPDVSPEVVPSGVPVSEAAFWPLEKLFLRLRRAPEARTVDLRLSPDTQEMFDRIVVECRRHGLTSEEEGASRRDVLYAGFVAKVPLHVARVALVLHLVEHKEPEKHEVSMGTIHDALRLVAFHTVNFRRVVAMALATEEQAVVEKITDRADRVADKIEDALRRAEGAWLSLRDLKREARIRDLATIRDRALQLLVEGGVAQRREKPSHTGSTMVEYRIKPANKEAA